MDLFKAKKRLQEMGFTFDMKNSETVPFFEKVTGDLEFRKVIESIISDLNDPFLARIFQKTIEGNSNYSTLYDALERKIKSIN